MDRGALGLGGAAVGQIIGEPPAGEEAQLQPDIYIYIYIYIYIFSDVYILIIHTLTVFLVTAFAIAATLSLSPSLSPSLSVCLSVAPSLSYTHTPHSRLEVPRTQGPARPAQLPVLRGAPSHPVTL